MEKQFREKLSGQLSSVAGEHDGALSMLNQMHADKVTNLEQQKRDLEGAQVTALAGKDDEFRKLMDRLQKKEAELQEHIGQENKHLAEIRKLNVGIVNRSKGLGTDTLTQAANNAKHPCIQAFLDVATNVRWRDDLFVR